MPETIQLASTRENVDARCSERRALAIRIDTVHVIFTTIDDTIAAVRVAAEFSHAMRVPLTLIHFRAVPYPLSIAAPPGLSPVQTDAFTGRLRAEGLDVRVRVFLCRNEHRVVPFAFTPRSLIVIGGRRSWWPTRSERWRRWLEAAGHFVLFVDASEHKEASHA